MGGKGNILKIYTSPNSPFGARITIAAIAKAINIEACALPSGGLRSEEYLDINPIAKIPVLVTETGMKIAESSVILDYLEDRFPEPSLLPADLEERARIRLVTCTMDRYVMAPVIRLFSQLNPETRDNQVVSGEVSRWYSGLEYLVHFMGSTLPKAEANVSLADCVLAPSLHLGTRIAALLSLDQDPMESYETLVEYYKFAKNDDLIGPVLSNLTHAQARKDRLSGLPDISHIH